ncbi:unnamed protein product [Adineta steineri]|uniref:Peptidase S1 domain-containing protein n=1 Tax=Adineta steineri TaxID=433720 RepID=A0A818IVM5_9BILA|nr:unnamed protein product [Adineta steineri]CAF3530742.1 unnamed protein product [Adineta steineri]
MQYSAPAFGGAASAGAATASTTKIIVIVVIVSVVSIAVFLGVVAIALGVGLGVGLRKSHSVTTPLSIPSLTCDSTSTCGCPSVTPAPSTRIINGNTATANSWPWMVYLTFLNGKVCSGFIISQRHVITASSCIKNNGLNITVYIGSIAYQSGAGGLNITSANYTTDNFDSIAIITLGINITSTQYPSIKPCCLSSDLTEPYVGEHGVIAGWGETQTTTLGNPAMTLQQAVVSINPQSTCSLSTSDTNEFCGSYNSINACPADAGGPFMTVYNNAWTCTGIITGQSSCQNPIKFTRIAAYAAFIRNVTSVIFL